MKINLNIKNDFIDQICNQLPPVRYILSNIHAIYFYTKDANLIIIHTSRFDYLNVLKYGLWRIEFSDKIKVNDIVVCTIKDEGLIGRLFSINE